MARLQSGQKHNKKPRKVDWSPPGVIASVYREVRHTQPSAGQSPGVEMFRLLPSDGFWWPVHVQREGPFGTERYRPPIDGKDCRLVLQSIARALRLGGDEEHRGLLLGDGDGEGMWEGRVRRRGVTREVFERAVAGLVVAAMEVLEEGVEAGIYEDPEGFVKGVKGRGGRVWWRGVDGEVMMRLLRLVMVARQGWLERLDGGRRGPQRTGVLVMAVDGLLNVLEGRFGGDVEVMDRHWDNDEGWEFVEGYKLEGAWV
ncbi:hypothetical protein B0T16DRAFT_491939 [Cercophora newfieldiana]|uniref:Uncharacterized protein n=1 Tax=Cercophora newfieldiana TaxID=92897 RepID=A0AA40CU32_9PEZI|nr:hypothetical protein B0T16DRAFT_491939 [Cercophora newfieldiana]